MNKITRISIPFILAFLFLSSMIWLGEASSHPLTIEDNISKTWNSKTPGKQMDELQNTLLVNTLQDELNEDGNCSLREAIQAANTNTPVDDCGSGDGLITDTITFNISGVITVTDQLQVINGGPLVIDGGGVITTSGDGITRVWWIDLNSDLTLQNFAVVNGYVNNQNGAGLYNDAGNLTINQCNFMENHFAISDSAHHYGGGIYSIGGTLEVFDSRFENNGSPDKYSHGGGIAILDASGQIIRTTFQNNISAGCYDYPYCGIPGGGGLYQYNGTVIIKDSQFISNIGTYGGGGITNHVGRLTITNSTFFDNSGLSGGGIFNHGDMTISKSFLSSNFTDNTGGGLANTGNITITESIFSDNSSSAGGGLYNYGTMDIISSTFSTNMGEAGGGVFNANMISITDSTFSANSAAEDGGGVANLPRIPIIGPYQTITNSTFSGNHAMNNGGGIYNSMINLAIINSTFTENSADGSGGGFYVDEVWSFLSIPITNTIIANSLSGGDCYGNAKIFDGGHNISSDDTCGFDPVNGSMPDTEPLLGPLQDNGGPTWTHELLAGSPAIDAGDNTQCPMADQRGIARPVDGDGDGWAVCDIGSYESTFSPRNIIISGPSGGFPNRLIYFTATVEPITTTLPLIYIWQTNNHSLITHTAGLSDTVGFEWEMPGTYTISVNASNLVGEVSDHLMITITKPINTYLPLVSNSSGTPLAPSVSFKPFFKHLQVSPSNASVPGKRQTSW
jgi:CSLREA domain-containing protein